MAIDEIPKHVLLDVEQLLLLLTLEEKVALTAGENEWQTCGIERLGIGALKVSIIETSTYLNDRTVHDLTMFEDH